MQTQGNEIIIGIVITLIVFLLIGFFILILIAYSNNRKKKFIVEKQTLTQLFTEQLLQSQIEIQEHTFNSISQEIHDNVGQTLSLAKVQLNIINQEFTGNNLLLIDAKDSVSKALSDLRDIANSLNSDRIKLLTLTEMTNQELQRIKRIGIMNTTLKVDGLEEPIVDQRKLILFRIIQESLQNILKHSDAKNIILSFNFTNITLQILIKDDGKGFDQASLTQKAGLGLQNIKNRAVLIGGSAFIDSIIDKGTAVKIIIPYA